MATALSGAVIVSQNEKEFTFSGKCDKCGKVQTNSKSVRKQLAPKSKLSAGSHKCSSCSHTSKIEFVG